MKPAFAAYPLPFMADGSWRVEQTWFDTPTHMGERAIDWNMGSGSDDEGLPVLSTCTGVVVYADWTTSGYGRIVLVDCGGIYQRTAHLKKILVQSGQEVSQGQVVGLIGGSGCKDGACSEDRWPTHLHLNFMDVDSELYPRQSLI